MHDTIESRYFRIGGRTLRNPHAEFFACLMKDMESLGIGIGLRRDYAAAVLEATIAARFDPETDIDVFLGVNDNIIALQGDGEEMRRISVALKSTDDAYARVSMAAIAHARTQAEHRSVSYRHAD